MRTERLEELRRIAGQLSKLSADDPPRAGRFTAVALLGLAVIWAWGLYGDLFLSNFIVVTTSAFLIAGYSGYLVVVGAEIMRSHDRWEVDSALTLRDMLVDRSEGGGVQAGSPFYLRLFRLRVEEEVRRCDRAGSPLTVVVIRLQLPGQSPSHSTFSRASAEMANVAAAHPDLVTCPTALGLFEYAFLLPGRDTDEAEAAAEVIGKALPRYRCLFGFALFPEDGASADDLLRFAMEQSDMLRTLAV